MRWSRLLPLLLVLLAARSAAAETASCHDGVRNGPESDVDCGGDCPACDLGRSCKRARECVSGLCADGVCVERRFEGPRGSRPPAGYELAPSGSDPGATARRAGLVFFSASYSAAYIAALSFPNELSWMYLPVGGPWLALSRVSERELKTVLIVDAVFQAGGAILLLGGIASSGSQLVRTETTQLHVVPQLGARGGGLHFAGSF